MEERYLLCNPNEEDGRFMLDEVMETGNMGHGMHKRSILRSWKILHANAGKQRLSV